MNEILEERWQLARERILEIPTETQVPEPYRDYFIRTARFLRQVFGILDIRKSGQWDALTLKERREWNQVLYEDILPQNYQNSYGNPRYAKTMLGKDFGKALSALYSQIRGSIVFVFEDRLWDLTVLGELFLEIYGEFTADALPEAENLHHILYSYIRDYCDDMMEYRVREMVDPKLDFAVSIIMEKDLTDLRYLYDFGEYISDNEYKTAEFLNRLSQEEIDRMAQTYTEGYRMGFVNNGIDLGKKKTVNIRYTLGFERMIRSAVLQFEKMGLKPVIYRSATHLINKRQHLRIGYFGGIPNQQFDYDHRNDAALYLTEEMVSRKLRALQNGFENCKELANTHAGPAVMETFGETPFVPKSVDCAYELTEKQQKLVVRMDTESSQITNRYIIGDERSFTIIAWPVPEIGESFEEIFRETIKINTLDYKKYQKIQQCMIDALDEGTAVHIKGSNGNRTDLTVCLISLADPARQTIFENCVADVNIPVGEVFTSPKLAGTSGVLHVTRVFLNGLEYRDLWLRFEDGMIRDYGCENFSGEEENRAYIRENVLHQHDGLPMGEFAVGTNTTAYVMAKKYQISPRLPILIAEKTGPHFAVGDTCYSWAEDNPVYNPDGKEVIARDNEVSVRRRENPSEAYFGCHTDITIPYDELEYIRILRRDGQILPLIEKGRFVLPGTEELNVPFSG
ncbi:MAG TPA: aminopeptidase [Candidatus Ruminococcus avistercoris]|nr:aminopeptidase [Candidatus Ruminococcus avistercoris]